MIIGGVDLGNLPLYLFLFANGSQDANWQGATKGFIGDVAVDGIQADERTSGGVPYAGTIYTNDSTLDAWQQIVDQNPGQASASYNEVARISGLEADLVSAIQQINVLAANPASLPAPYNVNFNGTIQSLDGLNTQNGINEVFVINITSGFNGISTKIDITGDAGDIFIFRWDTDANPANGYQGQVKFQSGGAIVPHGGLKATNFINVAGDINSSGGGTTPLPPYPQGPRYNDGLGSLIIGGQDFSGGGFFTGYWLTTGSPDIFDPVSGLYYGETASLSNGIFVGGWYTLTTKFSMTSGTSGVYVSPPFIAQPSIDVIKEVSPDNGVTWFDANSTTGPNVVSGTNPQFRFTVTNTGNVTLSNVVVTDNVYGLIGTAISLAPGASAQWTITRPWALGQQVNTATATGTYNGQNFTDTDPAYWFGVEQQIPAVDIEKEVSPNNGATWFDADSPPGPNILSGTNPQFRYIVTNTGNVTLTNVVVNDNVYGPIGTLPSLAPGASFSWIIIVPWQAGPHTNTATVTTDQGVTDTDLAHYVGVETPTPAVDLEKEVSPNNGVTWFDADTPPGPSIIAGTNPWFRFTVSNIGNVTLTNVVVSDNVYGPIGTLPSLAPGASFSWILIKPWQAGPHANKATVTTDQGVTDTDLAHYEGVEAPTPAIDVEKEVSPDNGVTWFDADTPPGPIIPASINPLFRYTVTNIGTVPLTNVIVSDDKLGVIGTSVSLAPTASAQWVVEGVWAFGEQVNEATATGSYNGQNVSDTDLAHYVGAANPDIDLEKEISVDGGITWFDADMPPYPILVSPMNPMYRFIVTNTGDVTLTLVSLSDSHFGLISIGGTLVPGETFVEFRTGTFASGQQCNEAIVTGVYVTPVGVMEVEDTDSACYEGIVGPAIDIQKYVSVDNGVTWIDADTAPGPLLPPGVNPQFKIVVTNTGDTELTNIQVTDNVLGFIASVPFLAQGLSVEWILP